MKSLMETELSTDNKWVGGVEDCEEAPEVAFISRSSVVKLPSLDDDVIVVGRDFDKHLSHLKHVFQRMQEAG